MPAEAPPSTLLEDLDDEQREAVLAPRGPVCVLAGAGTGKTRTITRRIAYLVASGHVAPSQVLAVTFTQRAAGEMRSRLRSLEQEIDGAAGSGAVQAMTFHAAALRQLRYFWPRVVGDTGWELLDSKFAVVAQAANRAGIHASTDDVRESPVIPMVETLVGRGYDVAIYDPCVKPEEIFGANALFLRGALPHFAKLMRADAEALVAESEVIVITNGSAQFKGLIDSAAGDKVVVDLHGLAKHENGKYGNYQGICW